MPAITPVRGLLRAMRFSRITAGATHALMSFDRNKCQSARWSAEIAVGLSPQGLVHLGLPAKHGLAVFLTVDPFLRLVAEVSERSRRDFDVSVWPK